MVALKCAYVSFLVLLCLSFSFGHRFILDTEDLTHEGQRHDSTDVTGIGKGFGFGSGGGSSGVSVGGGSGFSGPGNGIGSGPGGHGLGYGVGYGSGGNGYEGPRTGGSGLGIGVGSGGSVPETGGVGFIPGMPGFGNGGNIGFPGFGMGGSIRWPGFDTGGSVGLPGFDIGGGVGIGQGSNGGGAGTGSPSYGIGMGQGGSSGVTVPVIGFIPGYGQIGNGCTCSPACYNQGRTMQGWSVSKGNNERNRGTQNGVSRDEDPESITVAMEPSSPHETHESIVTAPESWSP